MVAAPRPYPWPARALFVGALALGFGLAVEVAVRVLDGNALPQLAIYEVRDGRLTLAAGAVVRGRRADGRGYTVRTGADGLRLPEAGDTLVVGDSQVLGLGVEDGDTFAAHAGARNAGVPGHGVADAVARARALAPSLRPARVVVCLNQANDWAEARAPATERYVVVGGWLGSPARVDSAAAAFWGSPLSRLHVLAWVALAAEARPAAPPTAPDPAADARTTTAFAAELAALQADLPAVQVVALFLPADAATSEARAARSVLGLPGRPWQDRSLRDGVRAALGPIPLVDPTDALADPDAFLDGDYHLSELGHLRVAEALAALGPPP